MERCPACYGHVLPGPISAWWWPRCRCWWLAVIYQLPFKHSRLHHWLRRLVVS